MKRLIVCALLLLLGALVANADVYDEQEALANTLSDALTEHFGQNVTLEKADWDPFKPRWIVEFQLEQGGMGEEYKFNVRKLGDYMVPSAMSRVSNGFDVSFAEAEAGGQTKRYEFEFHCVKESYDLQVWAYTDWITYDNATVLFDVTTQACIDYLTLPLVNEPSPTPEPTAEPTIEPIVEPDCDGYALGESWPAGDECNECICTPEGVECTEMDCDAIQEPTEEPTMEPAVEPAIEPTIEPEEEEEENSPLSWIAGLAILVGGAAIAYYEFKD